MRKVGIHQPNYLPWAGYFQKMNSSTVFVFLDDAQYPKNSYVNRVKIRAGDDASWLTVPAKPRLGCIIREVVCSQDDWARRHVSRLVNEYGKTPHFDEIWEVLEPIYGKLPTSSLAQANRELIEAIARRLGIGASLYWASDIPNPGMKRSDDRLVEIVQALGGDVYVSGKGGQAYQDPEKFTGSGITLTMTDFVPIEYDRGSAPYIPGLSIVDVLFHTGWERTADYIGAKG